MKWSEEELKALEIGVFGGFARVTLADEEDTKRPYPPQPSVHSPLSAARLRRGPRRLGAAAIVGRAVFSGNDATVHAYADLETADSAAK
jgi:hypothetical protein